MIIEAQKTIIKLAEIKFIGITARTNNSSEMNPKCAKIGNTMQRFFARDFSEQIQNKKNPGTIFSVYTNYESDFTGDYSYLIGQEVTSFEKVNEGFETLTIRTQNYAKFTSEQGKMPNVVIDMWQNIWKMTESDLGGERSYIADFEVYDERSYDPENSVVDIYIGIK